MPVDSGEIAKPRSREELLREQYRAEIQPIIENSPAQEATEEIVDRMVQLAIEQGRDKKTGLLLKNTANAELERWQMICFRYGVPLSVMMMDLDHFKKLNDDISHEAGDKAIGAMAEILKQNTRETDILSRYGGDEFFVILPYTNAEQALEIAERIRKMVPDTMGEITSKVKITTSIGIVQLAPDSTNSGKLIDQADEALRVAKKEKNKVVIYSQTDTEV